MATSSAAVSQVSKVAGLPAIRRSSSAVASAPDPNVTLRPPGARITRAGGFHRELAIGRDPRVAQRQRTRALSAMEVSSLGAQQRHRGTRRSPPALSTPNQHAAIIGLFGPRSSTRLPGTSPRSSTSTWAMRFARSSSSRVGPAAAGEMNDRRGRRARGDRRIEQLGGAVQPLGIRELRQLRSKSRSVRRPRGREPAAGRRGGITVCGVSLDLLAARQQLPAIISCWISLAPS